jgi:ribosomal protein S15P/S13E
MSYTSFPAALGLFLTVSVASSCSREETTSPPQAASVLDSEAEARRQVIEQLAAVLNERYVFPATALEMEQAIRARAARGEYKGMADRATFAAALTAHLQEVSKDKHLRVRMASMAPPQPGQNPLLANFGIGKAQVLPGDIGYLEISSFSASPAQARQAVADAMSPLAQKKALILDVRRNGGGSPAMVALIASYLFGEKPVHLSTLYIRYQNLTEHFYTDPNVPGEKFGSTKPVYVLTSRSTFSAAEGFAYHLQSLKRAVIVGEVTGGGAHAGGYLPLGNSLEVFVPSIRATNPITGTNWEGTGVKPDSEVAEDRALDAALEAIRRSAP